jgi:hypothetical protein
MTVDRDDGLPQARGQVPGVAVVARPHVPGLAGSPCLRGQVYVGVVEVAAPLPVGLLGPLARCGGDNRRIARTLPTCEPRARV